MEYRAQMQYLNADSISSRSTQTSSVFSGEGDDYDARIKEIEEYYMRTLLNENEDAGANAGKNAPAKAQHSWTNSRSVAKAILELPRQRSHPWSQPLPVRPSAPTQASPDLEVEINSQYRPSNGVLPLTSENLKLLQNPKLMPQKLECGDAATAAAAAETPSSSQGRKQGGGNEKCNKALYKTELCESFSTTGYCKYGNNCQFAHGLQELKFKERSNKFRTKPCINWMQHGKCRYGKRCCFKHGDDEDIQVYVKAGTVKNEIDNGHPRKNLHADVQALQRIIW